MIKEISIKKKLSWLLAEPSAYTIPSIRIVDKTLIILSRIFYIAIRIFLGKRREKSQFYQKLRFRLRISFSFYFFMFLYRFIRTFRLGNPSLVKIIVPKYN